MTRRTMNHLTTQPRLLILLAMIQLIPIPGVASTDLIEEARLDPGDGTFFADSVALSADGNTVIVSKVQSSCDDGVFCGEAHVYRRSGSSWHGPEVLTAPLAETEDQFGHAVTISGDGNRALVGAPFDRCTGTSIPCGAAYLFARDENGAWGTPIRLIGSDTMSFDRFGISAALSDDGNTALIGADSHSCPGFEFCGAAYVFVRQGEQWVEEQKLLSSDLDGFDFFGLGVALSADGDTALIGAPDDACPMGPLCGAGYIFRREELWNEVTKLVPSAPTGFDLAAYSVALSDDGDVAVIGSFVSGCTNQPSQCGAAYVFANVDGWSEEKHLTVPQGLDPAVELEFGISVSIAADGETALIGANCPFFQVGGLCAKRAFIYSRSGGDWLERQRLAPANGDPDGRFGYAVSLSSDTSQAIVGSTRAAYLFSTKLFTDGFESGDTSIWSETVD